MDAPRLTDLQEKFCRALMNTTNHTEAYIAAGGEAAEAGKGAGQMFARPSVQRRLRELREQRAVRLDLKADRVLSELLDISEAKITDVMEWDGDSLRVKPSSEIPEHIAKAIKRLKIRRTVRTDQATGDEIETIDYDLEMYDRLAALKAMGDHLGLFTPKETPSENNTTINLFTNMDADSIRALKAQHMAKLEALKDVTPDAVTTDNDPVLE